VFKARNPFSAFNRSKIRDLEGDLRGRGNVDATHAQWKLEALNPFSAFNRRQVRELEADLRRHRHVYGERAGSRTAAPDTGSDERGG
jgi:hypothetical protein